MIDQVKHQMMNVNERHISFQTINLIRFEIEQDFFSPEEYLILFPTEQCKKNQKFMMKENLKNAIQ